jgi:hypothetical protein
MAEKPKKKSAANRQPDKIEPDLPEWLTETPLDTEYSLTMDEGGLDGERCQYVDLTRKEFLILKVFLAKMRGVQVPTERPEGFRQTAMVIPLLWSELGAEEIAAIPEATHAN